jgi:hypothetical protein
LSTLWASVLDVLGFTAVNATITNATTTNFFTNNLRVGTGAGTTTPISLFANSLGTVTNYISTGDPNTFIIGSNGSMVSDVLNGDLYIKKNGTSASDWQRVLTASGTSAYTSGSILFANSAGNITQDNQVLYYDSTNNRIGFGTNTPGAFAGLSTVRLEFADDTGNNSDVLQRVAGGGWGAYVMAASQGTKAAPTIISNTGNFGETAFSGYDGAAYREGAIIRGSVDGTPALNSMPGKLVFMTTPSGSITPTERMRISANGVISMVGTTTFSTTTAASSSITIANISNLFGTLATITSATVTNLFANTIRFSGIDTTNSTITNSTTTNFAATNASSSFLIFGNATGNSATTTNFFSSIFTALTGYFTNLIGLNATITNATTTNLTTTNITATGTSIFANIFGTSATISNSTSTNFAATNILATGTASITNALVGNSTTTNSTSTNKFATNLRATNSSTTNASTTKLTVTGDASFGSFAVSNLGANGNITTAANIDAYTVFNLNQTTENIVPTIPNPTNTTAGKIIYINNVGTVSFQIASSHISPDTGRGFIWTGSAWSMLNEIIGGGTQIKTKSADQTRNSNVFINDTDLSFTIGANETILFMFDLLVNNSGSATPDFKAAILGPTGSTCRVNISGEEPASTGFPQVDTTNCTTPTAMVNGAINASAVDFNVRIQGTITSGGTAGTVNLQFAQNTTSAGFPIIMRAGSMLHAYKATGADLAEVYFTDDSTIREGHIVVMSGTGTSQVVKSTRNYQSNTLGIISTKPGLVLAETDGEGRPVIVGLSGRVPVKVTGKNGSIKSGDFITASDISGLGMRATDAGQVVGQALNEFVATSTDSTGVVMVFIKNQYYDGGDEYVQNSEATVLADGSIADRFTHLFRRAFEKVTNIFLDMTLWIRNVKSDRVQTKELCIDDVCVTKEQLQQMLLNNAVQNNANSTTTIINTEENVGDESNNNETNSDPTTTGNNDTNSTPTESTTTNGETNDSDATATTTEATTQNSNSSSEETGTIINGENNSDENAGQTVTETTNETNNSASSETTESTTGTTTTQ